MGENQLERPRSHQDVAPHGLILSDPQNLPSPRAADLGTDFVPDVDPVVELVPVGDRVAAPSVL
jgi:hypothetical protein